MYDVPSWNGDKMYLYSQTGYNLTIRSDSEVLGTTDDNDRDSRLQLLPVGPSEVRIFGLNSGLYLCFNAQGELYGEADPNVEATVFIEDFQGSYNGYRSKVYPDWYVGIKKSGCIKNGNRAGWGQKAVKFLPRKKSFSD